MLYDTIRILIPAALAFVIGISITPILSYYLYKYKAWKKRPGKMGLDGRAAEEFNRLHQEHEVRAPRMGGVVIWASAVITIFLISLLAHLFP
jgi:UDP-N-acetylmuramyl pentapeptide phosphotransferase/UDP-N-acetylglucosamine-1-phosphate transferase